MQMKTCLTTISLQTESNSLGKAEILLLLCTEAYIRTLHNQRHHVFFHKVTQKILCITLSVF